MNPEITILYQYYDKKALFKVPKLCKKKIWIENDPFPPFGTFPKIHLIWKPDSSLRVLSWYFNNEGHINQVCRK